MHNRITNLRQILCMTLLAIGAVLASVSCRQEVRKDPSVALIGTAWEMLDTLYDSNDTLVVLSTSLHFESATAGHYLLKEVGSGESISYPLLYKYLAAQDCYQIYSNLTPDAGIVIDTCWAKVDWEHNLLWCYGDKDLKDQDPDFCHRIK